MFVMNLLNEMNKQNPVLSESRPSKLSVIDGGHSMVSSEPYIICV